MEKTPLGRGRRNKLPYGVEATARLPIPPAPRWSIPLGSIEIAPRQEGVKQSRKKICARLLPEARRSNHELLTRRFVY